MKRVHGLRGLEVIDRSNVKLSIDYGAIAGKDENEIKILKSRLKIGKLTQ